MCTFGGPTNVQTTLHLSPSVLLHHWCDSLTCCSYTATQFFHILHLRLVHKFLYVPLRKISEGLKFSDLWGHEIGPPAPRLIHLPVNCWSRKSFTGLTLWVGKINHTVTTRVHLAARWRPSALRRTLCTYSANLYFCIFTWFKLCRNLLHVMCIVFKYCCDTVHVVLRTVNYKASNLNRLTFFYKHFINEPMQKLA
jgi:hypothetical protein